MGRLSESMQPGVYAGGAGYKERGTSRDAARAIAPTLADRQREVLRVIAEAGPRGLTPHEAADKLGVDVTAARPRFTELGPDHHNLIEPTGERRATPTGLKAKAYRTRKDPA